MTMKAPAGPPICTREPPSAEMRNPAMIAVNRPASGFRPEAMAKAMASGSAITPTVRPAPTSAASACRSYPFRHWSRRGRKACSAIDSVCRGFLVGRCRQPGRQLALAGVRDHVHADQLAHDLRRRDVLRGANVLEHALLARIDQDGEAGGLVLHLRSSEGRRKSITTAL